MSGSGLAVASRRRHAICLVRFRSSTVSSQDDLPIGFVDDNVGFNIINANLRLTVTVLGLISYLNQEHFIQLFFLGWWREIELVLMINERRVFIDRLHHETALFFVLSE